MKKLLEGVHSMLSTRQWRNNLNLIVVFSLFPDSGGTQVAVNTLNQS